MKASDVIRIENLSNAYDYKITSFRKIVQELIDPGDMEDMFNGVVLTLGEEGFEPWGVLQTGLLEDIRIYRRPKNEGNQNDA